MKAETHPADVQSAYAVYHLKVPLLWSIYLFEKFIKRKTLEAL